ncbi:hypothetical protein ACFC4G_42685 [Streptomyces sp. NPDC056002]|uniref:hypothetical protein n=1 Tax=Streptomyces sp. NPDC056002 TaxID=3345675 RepID=UPI0035D93522
MAHTIAHWSDGRPFDGASSATAPVTRAWPMGRQGSLICLLGWRHAQPARIHLDRGPAKGRRKGFTETDYAHQLDAAHQQLGGPMSRAS